MRKIQKLIDKLIERNADPSKVSLLMQFHGKRKIVAFALLSSLTLVKFFSIMDVR